MSKYKTFSKGGIHPSGRKYLTSDKMIRNAVLPGTFVVPMLQHLGKPADCVVAKGDSVKEGMLLGKASGYISAPVHSPVPGVVKEIRDVFLANGIRSQAVVIEMEGEFDRSGKTPESMDWEALSGEELNSLLAEMGIVGLGGATFPVHVKYAVPKGLRAEHLVINGSECEPYLTADYRLMLERAEEILNGIRIVARILNPDDVLIGIENNKPEAIRTLGAAMRKLNLDYRIVPLKTRYPQGDEKQLLKAIIGKEVPSGALPIQIGAVVSNIGTVFAVHEAITFRKPLMERVVTVSGEGIKRPANLKVRVGTPIRSLIEECGGFTETPARVIVGGPMMGFAVHDLDTPVTKGTSGILALTKKEVRSAAPTACLSCGRCVQVCPMGLNPTSLYKAIDHMQFDTVMAEGLMDCKECGCCAYSCPAHIPLVQGMRLGKKLIREKKVKVNG